MVAWTCCDDDDDDDDGGDVKITFTTQNWTSANAKDLTPTKKFLAVSEDEWAKAGRSAKEAKVSEEQRKARQAKTLADAEEGMKKRFTEHAQRDQEIRAQRQEAAAKEAAKEEEAREATREAVRAQVHDVVQTVDLDLQCTLMAEYEDHFAGGASPSSDLDF